jgi:hypothetical protein
MTSFDDDARETFRNLKCSLKKTNALTFLDTPCGLKKHQHALATIHARNDNTYRKKRFSLFLLLTTTSHTVNVASGRKSDVKHL